MKLSSPHCVNVRHEHARPVQAIKLYFIGYKFCAHLFYYIIIHLNVFINYRNYNKARDLMHVNLYI